MTPSLNSFDCNRARGAFLGLAIGDAVGATVEFCPRGSFAPVDDMTGGGPHALRPGEWTDDTIMALCLAESLVDCRGFDPIDQLRRYVAWWREGHNSPKGYCFDIGRTTSAALAEFERTGEPYRTMHERNGGNGSLMRLAPIALAYREPEAAARFAEAQGYTTHASAEAGAACRVYARALVAAIGGASREEALAPSLLCPSGEILPAGVTKVLAGSYRTKAQAAVRSGGYVVDSLEAALWCVWRASDFREAVLLAANLGHDADTTAAIAGQLAGALWGWSSIPAAWQDRVFRAHDLLDMADALVALDLAGVADSLRAFGKGE